MPRKQVYIDPSIDTDTGDGLSTSTPYGRLTYALAQETENTTGGTQFNIKSGASVVQGATRLDSLLTWSPLVASPVIFRGYTATANDGGQFDWDLNNNWLWEDVTTKGNYLNFVDGKFHNMTSAGTFFVANDYNYFHNIHFDNIHTTGSLINMDNYCGAFSCHFSGITCNANHILLGITGLQAHDCFFDGRTGGGNTMTYSQAAAVFSRNIYVCADDNTTEGWVSAHTCLSSSWNFTNNSYLKLGKTSAGTAVYAPSTRHTLSYLLNNCFEGFTTAFQFGSNDSCAFIRAGNAFYDNTINDNNGDGRIVEESEEDLAGSPFAKSGALSYENRADYFAPADIGNVRTGAYGQQGASYLSKGAIQYAGTGGGGVTGSRHPLKGR